MLAARRVGTHLHVEGELLQVVLRIVPEQNVTQKQWGKDSTYFLAKRVNPHIQAPPVDAGRPVKGGGPWLTNKLPDRSMAVDSEFMISGSAFQCFLSS